MKVICISGKAGHGKDYTAELLKEELEKKNYSVLITHNADLLKFICTNYFGWNGEKDEEGRNLLQYIGTDVFREQNEDFWVEFIFTMLVMSPVQWDFVIVSDCRFPNEIQYYREGGMFNTTHIKVQRNNYESELTEEAQNHESETALDNISPDILMINDGTDEYKRLVSQLAETLIQDYIVFGNAQEESK